MKKRLVINVIDNEKVDLPNDYVNVNHIEIGVYGEDGNIHQLRASLLIARNFEAKLPKDFLTLISVSKSHKELEYVDILQTTAYFSHPDSKDKNYCTIGDTIMFSGSFSRWWIKRVFQRIWDKWFPKIYVLKYIST